MENYQEESILNRLASELNIPATKVSKAVELLDEGNTVPFIARYRKEATGGLTDEELRHLSEKLFQLRNLEKTRNMVLKQLKELDVLTPELESAVKSAGSATELDDLYRPYRPKRRTRATVAREKGLEPLARLIMEGAQEPFSVAEDYLDSEKDVPDAEKALAGARDLIAEIVSAHAAGRKKLRSLFMEESQLTSRSSGENETSPYEMYYQFSQPVKKMQSHRVLAVNRGEKEGYLQVKIDVPEEKVLGRLEQDFIPSSLPTQAREQMKEAIQDSYKRLLFPSLEREIRGGLTEKAEEQALLVFRDNLKNLLMTPPVRGKRILGLDPGYRTGCKLACIDETGRFLETSVIYPLQPFHRKEDANEEIKRLVEKHGINAVSIGNGTGGRESEEFIARLLPGMDTPVEYTIVNEAGASVYSASSLASAEFPDLDVGARSAVSIARRVQDPLAELVKIEPRSIGVGQYQHDINQKRLEEVLDGVVEDCVNQVGVNLNTASAALLGRVAGITRKIASSMVTYREENGSFASREELKKVPGLGPATFKQCAGFLRIPYADNYFDRSAVHPESYEAASRVMEKLGLVPGDLGNPEAVPPVNASELAKELELGEFTLRDILAELKKPGRDPREDLPSPVFKKEVLNLEDLYEGLELTGVVRNVVDFGVFVDIGVHQDGLIHISELDNKFVHHPGEVLKVGDNVRVQVLSVEVNRKRISLSRKALL